MPNLSHREIQRLPDAARHEASTFTLAVVMAGIFAFFIAGIASAFIYARTPIRRRPRQRQNLLLPRRRQLKPRAPAVHLTANNASVFAKLLDS